MNDSMDGYLSYLKDRIKVLETTSNSVALKEARAEFSRALAYARSNGQTINFAKSDVGKEMTLERIQSAVNSYLDIKHSSSSSSFYYGFSCDECGSSVVARDRKKLVRNDASRTLCWDCMDAGADMHIEPKRSAEEVTKAGGRC